MAVVVLKSDPSVFRVSANTPDFPTENYLINPASFATLHGTVDPKYWKVVADDIAEMTQGEKDAVDAAEVAAVETDAKDSAKSVFDGTDSDGRSKKAMLEMIMDELNILRALHGLADRTPAQIRTAYRNKVDS